MPVIYAENAQVAGNMVGWGLSKAKRRFKKLRKLKKLASLRKNKLAMTALTASTGVPFVALSGDEDEVGKGFKSLKKIGKKIGKVAKSKAGVGVMSFAAGATSAVLAQKAAKSATGQMIKSTISDKWKNLTTSDEDILEQKVAALEKQNEALRAGGQTAQPTVSVAQRTDAAPQETVQTMAHMSPLPQQTEDQASEEPDDVIQIDRSMVNPAQYVQNAPAAAPANLAKTSIPSWMIIAAVAAGGYVLFGRH